RDPPPRTRSLTLPPPTRRGYDDRARGARLNIYGKGGMTMRMLFWVLPGFVWVKIRWSKSFVFKAWGLGPGLLRCPRLSWGAGPAGPPGPAPNPPTPFPSSLFPLRIPRCERIAGTHRHSRDPGHA